MAWEISISLEGWANIHEKLETWAKKELVDAIAEDYACLLADQDKNSLDEIDKLVDNRRKFLHACSHDTLVYEAFQLIHATNTCDNGGFAYWIDREGCHKVHLD